MPKLQNVQETSISGLLDNLVFEASQVAKDYADRIEKGYCGELKEPIALARSALSAARCFSDLAAQLLTKGAMDEMCRETKRLIRERDAKQ